MNNNDLTLLVDALQANDTLTNLNLSLVGLGDNMADQIAEMVESNKSLVSIDLSRNGISPWGGDRLAAALERNDRLTALSLDLNNVGAVAAQRIQAKLCSNRPALVLTLRCLAHGHETLTVGCQCIGGDLYAVELSPADRLQALRAHLLSKLRPADVRLEFVLPDGLPVAEEADDKTVAELLLLR
jgi:hypothetical protein